MDSVKPYTTILNKYNSYWMARLSKAVYYRCSDEDPSPDEDRILEELKNDDIGFQSVKGFSKNSAQAAIIEHNDYICMVFRGTDEGADWLDNANIFHEEVLFGKFHRGFWNSVQDVWEGMFLEYNRCKEIKKRPLFLTGHSLGGAMATVAAAKLIDQDLPFTSVYTFGQPRAVTRDTARIFNSEAKSRYFRFQNNNDLVTRVPSRLMGFSHVGSYLYISEEKKLYNDPGFWFRFLDYIDGAIHSVMEKGIDSIQDHNIDHYLNAVEKWDCNF